MHKTNMISNKFLNLRLKYIIGIYYYTDCSQIFDFDCYSATIEHRFI